VNTFCIGMQHLDKAMKINQEEIIKTFVPGKPFNRNIDQNPGSLLVRDLVSQIMNLTIQSVIDAAG